MRLPRVRFCSQDNKAFERFQGTARFVNCTYTGLTPDNKEPRHSCIAVPSHTLPAVDLLVSSESAKTYGASFKCYPYMARTCMTISKKRALRVSRSVVVSRRRPLPENVIALPGATWSCVVTMREINLPSEQER